MMKKFVVLIAMIGLCHSVMAQTTAYWRFDDASGTTAVNQVNSPDLDGTLKGDAAFVTTDLPSVAGGNVSAVSFDGTGDWIATDVIGISGANARTICAWIKVDPAVSGSRFIVTWGNSWGGAATLGHRFTFKTDNGKLRAEIGGGFAVGTMAVHDGTWHHVAVVVDQDQSDISQVRFYIDGVQDAVADSGNANPINSDAAKVDIGVSSWDGSGYFIGLMDEVAIFDRALTVAQIQSVMDAKRVWAPAPTDGASMVAADVTVSWQAPAGYTPSAYNLYYGTDPNMDTYVSQTGIATNEFALTLENDATYYWRVDAVEGAAVHPGMVWAFSTAPAIPVVTVEPQSVTVAPGSEAVLSVEGVNQVACQWYRNGTALSDGGKFSGTSTTELTISNVDIDVEDVYYCVLSNSVDTVQTKDARVMSGRLVSHWNFDGSTNDSTGSFDGQMAKYELQDVGGEQQLVAVAADPNYTAGINGQAMEFFGDGEFVEIPGSEDFFNFYPQGFTVNAWVTVSPETTGYHSVVTKHQGQPSSIGWVVNTVDNDATFVVRGTNPVYIYAGKDFINDGSWHMITCQYDAAESVMKTYVDGVLARVSGKNSKEIPVGDAPVRIGINNGTEIPFVGLIDDVSIYSYPLNAYEVAGLYTADGFADDVSICVENPEFDVTGPAGEPDCRVDLCDFAEFAKSWLECNIVPECR